MTIVKPYTRKSKKGKVTQVREHSRNIFKRGRIFSVQGLRKDNLELFHARIKQKKDLGDSIQFEVVKSNYPNFPKGTVKSINKQVILDDLEKGSAQILDFPKKPAVGQKHKSADGFIYEWNGYLWIDVDLPKIMPSITLAIIKGLGKPTTKQALRISLLGKGYKSKEINDAIQDLFLKGYIIYPKKGVLEKI